MEKPKVKDIIAIEEELRTRVYSEVHKQFEEDEKFYELEFKSSLGLPQEVSGDGTVLPTARDLVDTAVDHTDIANMRVHVSKKAIKKGDEVADEMMRKFYLGVAYRTNVESPISPWRVAAKHYWNLGVGVLKTLWDADKWPDKPLRGDDEIDKTYNARIEEWQGKTELSVPILIQAVHPSFYMPDPNHIEPQFVIQSEERPVYAIRKNYPLWKEKKSYSPTDKVRWIEWWDEEWKCYIVDGEYIIRHNGGVVRHNYGFIPYTQMDTGLGNYDSEGSIKNRWVGINRYSRDVLISESRNYSIRDIILKSGAWPWYAAKDDQNGAKIQALKDMSIGYGQIVPLNGITLEKMAPDIPSDALRIQQMMSSDILASHAAPRSVRGMSEQGVRSGADRRLLLAEAGTRYSYATQAFQYGTAKALINCAKLFKNVIPGDVRLWAKTPRDNFDVIIKKEDMKEPFMCDVEFSPISEEDEYRRHDDLRLLVQGLALPPKWAWSRMPDVDPNEIEKMVEEEKFKNDPNIQGVKSQYIAQRLQLALQQKQNAQQLAVQTARPQMMGGPGRMTTHLPQQMVQGSPTQTQAERAKQSGQANVPLNPGQGEGGGGANYVR